MKFSHCKTRKTYLEWLTPGMIGKNGGYIGNLLHKHFISDVAKFDTRVVWNCYEESGISVWEK